MMNEIHTNLNKTIIKDNNYKDSKDKNSKNNLENSLVNTKLSQWFSKIKV